MFKKRKELKLKKWCIENISVSPNGANEVYKWITSAQNKRELSLRKWCIKQARRVNVASCSDPYDLFRAQKFLDWITQGVLPESSS